MLQSFYIKDGLYTMKDVIKSTLHVFCRHNMRYTVMQRTTLHTYSQSRALGCGKELERIGSDLSWNFECYMYWDVFFCCSSPYLVGCFYFGRPERAGQQSFFGAQWPEHLVWCLLTARLLVASDSCRHVAENTFLVDEVFRFIKLHYSHTNLELPVVTFCLSGKEIISPNVLALSRWQYNHIQNQDILHTVIKHMSKYSQDKKNVQPISNLRFYALSGP